MHLDGIVREARRKLAVKKLDLVIANDVSRTDAGFAADTNAGMLVSADTTVAIPVMGKDELARLIVEWAEKRYS